MHWSVGLCGITQISIEFTSLKGAVTRLAIATLVVFRLRSIVFALPSYLDFFSVLPRQPTIQELYS